MVIPKLLLGLQNDEIMVFLHRNWCTKNFVSCAPFHKLIQTLSIMIQRWLLTNNEQMNEDRRQRGRERISNSKRRCPSCPWVSGRWGSDWEERPAPWGTVCLWWGPVRHSPPSPQSGGDPLSPEHPASSAGVGCLALWRTCRHKHTLYSPLTHSLSLFLFRSRY